MESFTFPGASGSLAADATDASSISSKLVFLNSCDFWATSLGQLHLQFRVHPQVEMERSSSFQRPPLFSSLGSCSSLCLFPGTPACPPSKSKFSLKVRYQILMILQPTLLLIKYYYVRGLRCA